MGNTNVYCPIPSHGNDIPMDKPVNPTLATTQV